MTIDVTQPSAGRGRGRPRGTNKLHLDAHLVEEARQRIQPVPLVPSLWAAVKPLAPLAHNAQHVSLDAAIRRLMSYCRATFSTG